MTAALPVACPSPGSSPRRGRASASSRPATPGGVCCWAGWDSGRGSDTGPPAGACGRATSLSAYPGVRAAGPLGRERAVGHAVAHDDPLTAPPLLDDAADLSALRAKGADPDELFADFAAWAEASGTVLYPAQEEALIELVSGANVVLATPTGSGKSLVATGAQYAALAAGRRSYYTAPIKALVSEKFFALCGVFGAANVGMLTGDAGGQRRRADHRLHRRGAGQHRAARGRRRRHRPRGHGRVPLLRRPRPRLGLAGAAAGAAEGPVPADVGHPRRRHVPARGPHPPHRPADRAGRQRRAPGAAAPLLRDHADARDDPATCSTPSRRRSTSSTSPRPRRWSGRRR